MRAPHEWRTKGDKLLLMWGVTRGGKFLAFCNFVFIAKIIPHAEITPSHRYEGILVRITKFAPTRNRQRKKKNLFTMLHLPQATLTSTK